VVTTDATRLINQRHHHPISQPQQPGSTARRQLLVSHAVGSRKSRRRRAVRFSSTITETETCR